MARYRSQNAGLHSLYDDILHEELPPKIAADLETRRGSVPPWAAMAAAIALFVVGAAGGWMVRGETETTQQLASAPPIDTQELMVRASMAHVVSHEDELRSASNGGTAAVGDYLADRMGKPVPRAAALTSFGYRLVDRKPGAARHQTEPGGTVRVLPMKAGQEGFAVCARRRGRWGRYHLCAGR